MTDFETWSETPKDRTSLDVAHDLLCSLDDRVLVMGGMATDTNPRDFFRSIDLEENKWKSLPPMPTPRYASFVFLINEKLYVIGEELNILTCLKVMKLFCAQLN